MIKLADYPLIVFAFALLVLWLSARTGSFLLKKQRNLEAGVREDFTVILAATLTLLALIIGFAFSIAISRYDQRKNALPLPFTTDGRSKC
jgi:ABC-type Fe3+ transport system permease subunit